MQKLAFTFVFLVFLASALEAQGKYFTRNGKITFSSDAPLEKIEADNRKVVSVVDFETGRIEFAVLIKAFQFEKALMQEHFNENYMESNKYPKATFEGTIKNINTVDLTKDGTYPVFVAGALTIHGVTKEVEVEGKIAVKEGAISAASQFEVLVADYDIKIPSVVRDNIAKIVRINIDLGYEVLDKKV